MKNHSWIALKKRIDFWSFRLYVIGIWNVLWMCTISWTNSREHLWEIVFGNYLRVALPVPLLYDPHISDTARSCLPIAWKFSGLVETILTSLRQALSQCINVKIWECTERRITCRHSIVSVIVKYHSKKQSLVYHVQYLVYTHKFETLHSCTPFHRNLPIFFGYG